MCLWICWFVLICVCTNLSAVCSHRTFPGGISECFIHVTETWNKVLRMIRWSLLAFTLSPLLLLLPGCWSLSLPSSRPWKGNVSLVSVIHFRALLSWGKAGRVPSHSGAPQGGKIPSNPCCGTPMRWCHWPTTVPSRPSSSSLGRGSGSNANIATKLRCPLC